MILTKCQAATLWTPSDLSPRLLRGPYRVERNHSHSLKSIPNGPWGRLIYWIAPIDMSGSWRLATALSRSSSHSWILPYGYYDHRYLGQALDRLWFDIDLCWAVWTPDEVLTVSASCFINAQMHKLALQSHAQQITILLVRIQMAAQGDVENHWQSETCSLRHKQPWLRTSTDPSSYKARLEEVKSPVWETEQLGCGCVTAAHCKYLRASVATPCWKRFVATFRCSRVSPWRGVR